MHCNVIFRLVRVTILEVESNRFMSVCICSLNHSVCNAHAPHYIVICGPSVCTAFFHIMS